MKVDNPRFSEGGQLKCDDCPYTGVAGIIEHRFWGKGYCHPCPTPETYAEACRLAAEPDH